MALMLHSREPLRDVVSTPEALQDCLTALSAAKGPVAFDTERAHGHRYWPKAYLLQIRREGAGTWLIDPVAFEHDGIANLASIVEVCGEATWIIHAASQDLPCMRDLGIIPPKIFDSELAARLLGKPGASLSALLLAELGIELRKAHSADNWSKRPLPESWLTYAALDVDYLPDLAQVLADELVRMGRHEWAEQEFHETLGRYRGAAEPKLDPWRRLSGLSSLRSPQQLAVARELWLERDGIAQRRDRPPSWIVPDAAIVEVAGKAKGRVPGRPELLAVEGFTKAAAVRYQTNWLAALDRVESMHQADYPPRHVPFEGTPNPRSWERSNPEAAARWAQIKPAIEQLACDLGGLQPSLIAPPGVIQPAVFHHAQITGQDLLALGARPWQVDFLVPLIAEALA